MNVGDLRKKLEGVADEMVVVVVNDYGYGEIVYDLGAVGVETRLVCDPENPWNVNCLAGPKNVFVLPETSLQWTSED